jgi:hypothetical protein
MVVNNHYFEMVDKLVGNWVIRKGTLSTCVKSLTFLLKADLLNRKGSKVHMPSCLKIF